MTGDRSLAEHSPSQNALTRERETDLGVSRVKHAQEQIIRVCRAAGDVVAPREKTKTSNAIRIILFLTARETVTVNSLLEEFNPTGIGVNVQGVTFQNVDIAASS